MALVLNSRDFAIYHQRLAQGFRPALLRGVHSGAARSVDYLVERTRAAPPANPAGVGSGGAVNTGAFARGWRVVRLPDGAYLTNVEGHGPVVEHGRRRGAAFPRRDALVAWIRRRIGASAKEAARLYYPIARSIARRGLIGRRILTAHEARAQILRFVTAEVIAELNREMGRR